MAEVTKSLLDEAIDAAKLNLDISEPGSEGRKEAVNELEKLYKLKLEETKTNLEFEEKWHRRVMDSEAFEEQVKARKIDNILRAAGIGLPIGVSLIFTVWGFKFEEEGTFTSDTFKWLRQKFVGAKH